MGLKWTDVDLDAGILAVQRSLDTDGTFNPPKRNKSRRTVKLTGQAVEPSRATAFVRTRSGCVWAPSGKTTTSCSLTNSAGR